MNHKQLLLKLPYYGAVAIVGGFMNEILQLCIQLYQSATLESRGALDSSFHLSYFIFRKLRLNGPLGSGHCFQ
jgi:hypothetical protein